MKMKHLFVLLVVCVMLFISLSSVTNALPSVTVVQRGGFTDIVYEVLPNGTYNFLFNTGISYSFNLNLLLMNEYVLMGYDNDVLRPIRKYNSSDNYSLIETTPFTNRQMKGITTYNDSVVFLDNESIVRIRHDDNMSDINKYERSDLYGDFVTNFAEDEDYYYVIGIGDKDIKAYNKDDLTLDRNSFAVCSDNNRNHRIAVSNEYVFVYCHDTTRMIYQYNKTDLSKTAVEITSPYSWVRNIKVSDEHLYLHGSSGERLRKYDVNDLTYIGQMNQSLTGWIQDFIFHDDLVIMASTGGGVYYYNKTTMGFIEQHLPPESMTLVLVTLSEPILLGEESIPPEEPPPEEPPPITPPLNMTGIEIMLSDEDKAYYQELFISLVILIAGLLLLYRGMKHSYDEKESSITGILYTIISVVLLLSSGLIGGLFTPLLILSVITILYAIYKAVRTMRT